MKVIDDHTIAFHCPGCKTEHRLNIDPTRRPCWYWDGRQSIEPSVLTTINGKDHKHHNPDAATSVCHCFVRNGQIKFLNDSTHDLKGQTVPLGDYPMPFPRELPKEQVMNVIAYFRGDRSRNVLEDCYDILGYGLFIGIGTSEQLIVGEGPLSDDQKADILQSVIMVQGDVQIPWKMILMLVLDLIQKNLK